MDARVLILYYSRLGATLHMAELIAEGVESASAVAVLRTVPSVSASQSEMDKSIPTTGPVHCTKQDLQTADALILGSPTRFGNMAAPLKFFLDSTSAEWMSGTLAGKPAAVFTSTSSMHGGQESTLLSMMLPLLHHGMIISGIPYTEPKLGSTRSGGTPYGASHLAGEKSDLPISEDEKSLCIALGKRVAFLAQKLK